MVLVGQREHPRPEIVASIPQLRVVAPIAAFVLAITMTYGFEIFSFHLTLDEELFGEATSTGYAQSWLSQGRWAMGALTLLVPSPVVPVVSTLLGVVLTAIAVWLVCRRCMDMDLWPTAVVAAVASTLPTLAFMFSFSTIAYGIGVGNILLVAYFVGISSTYWARRVLGVVALSCAVGIYDSFLAAGAVLAIAFVCRRPTWFRTGMALGSLTLAFALSKAITFIGQSFFGIARDSYVGRFLDVPGLLQDPVGRTKRAVTGVWQVASLSAERFGLHSPWLLILLAGMVGLAVLGAVRTKGIGLKLTNLLGLAGLLLIPVAVEMVSPYPVLLRSMVYLPVIVAVLAGLAVKGLNDLPKRPGLITMGVMGAVAVLAVVGQATISNRLFAASEMTYAQDQNLAFVIGQEKERLVETLDLANVPIYIAGTHQWPISTLTPAKENFGTSFFSAPAGPEAAQYRGAAFLRSQGVAVRMPDGSEMERGLILAETMPSYPHPGWMSYEDGILVINFGLVAP